VSELIRPGSRLCLCRACNQYFSSPTSFDKHRAGSYPERRCLSQFEMPDAGLEPDARGIWRRAVESLREVA